MQQSRSTLGWEPTEEEIRGAMPPVRWPLVRVHAGSGRKTLYIGSHARRVIGLPLPAGRILLRDLQEHVTQPAFVYANRASSGLRQTVASAPDGTRAFVWRRRRRFRPRRS